VLVILREFLDQVTQSLKFDPDTMSVLLLTHLNEFSMVMPVLSLTQKLTHRILRGYARLKFDSETYSLGRILRSYARLKATQKLTHLGEFSVFMPV
jgi:hypothetical protein